MSTHSGEGHRGKQWLGIGGVPPGERDIAYRWERRLHWVMIGIALLSIPAFYLEEFAEGRRSFRLLGSFIEIVILVAFAAELAWMLSLTRQKGRYLARNWLDVLVVVFGLASVAGIETEWVALVRLLRVVLVAMLLARAFAASRFLFRKGGLPYLLAFGFVALIASGFGFYWLEPTVHSFSEGLWLAFVTGATVGYGDFAPTTPAARLFAVFIVIVGVATISLLTANVAALVIGEDESRMRQEMHEDIRQLRVEVARMIGEEERAVVHELHRDVRSLREEIAQLRREIEKDRRRD